MEKVYLTDKQMFNIKKQIIKSRKEIKRLKIIIPAYREAIKHKEEGIKENERLLKKGVIKPVMFNNLNLTNLKFPYFCTYKGRWEKRKRGIITVGYDGKFFYQLNRREPKAEGYSTIEYTARVLKKLFEYYEIQEEVKNSGS